ncbi:hypothetical protein ACFL5O_01270 [Myxococcota bacterium]
MSRSDRPRPAWKRGFSRYRETGVLELVRFDPVKASPVRVWDRIRGDLVEHQLDAGAPAACLPLKLFWVVVHHERYGPMLRLARDRDGLDLLPTPTEQEAEARLAAEAAHEREAKARLAAEQRVAELEAALRRGRL